MVFFSHKISSNLTGDNCPTYILTLTA
jgi:hypothetical protein